MSRTGTRAPIVPASRSTTAGPFSPGIRLGPLLQVAGQVGIAPAPPEGSAPAPEASVRAQTRQALGNVGEILAEGGTGWEDVLMIRVYLIATSHFDEFNGAYRDYLGEQGCTIMPARTTVYVGLPPGLLVEIDALAVPDDR
ncbi:RidA family protein [Streptomyces cylindrosporus]|uniref:RidA family protein n=1 Tax=Streptomyces cylindrosporus TaxID=2927583 RepID=A0ABS9YKS2_9ACTN|nr:RidA family protein [Streptomyces cylindrosporus]MCI3277804.1 RidA family protein [Streptomyces cylindrosporus]